MCHELMNRGLNQDEHQTMGNGQSTPVKDVVRL